MSTHNTTNDAVRQELIQRARANFFPASIPDELKAYTKWVCFSYQWRNERWAKPPITEIGYAFDPINDSNYFQSFDRAVERFLQDYRIAGLGIILPGDGSFAALDMDGCLVGRNLTDFAKAQIRRLMSYTEISPSGQGIRILCHAPGVRISRKTAEIEFYTYGRYVSVTGRHIKNTPDRLEDRHDEFVSLLDDFSQDEIVIERGEVTHRGVSSSTIDQGTAGTNSEAWDNWVWQKMLNAKNGLDLQRIIETGDDHLTQNDTEKYQFTGEWRVISSLVFHSKGNLDQVMRIMLSDRCRMFHRDRWLGEDRPGFFDKRQRVSFLQYEIERAISLNVAKGYLK